MIFSRTCYKKRRKGAALTALTTIQDEGVCKAQLLWKRLLCLDVCTSNEDIYFPPAFFLWLWEDRNSNEKNQVVDNGCLSGTLYKVKLFIALSS